MCRDLPSVFRIVPQIPTPIPTILDRTEENSSSRCSSSLSIRAKTSSACVSILNRIFRLPTISRLAFASAIRIVGNSKSIPIAYAESPFMHSNCGGRPPVDSRKPPFTTIPSSLKELMISRIVGRLSSVFYAIFSSVTGSKACMHCITRYLFASLITFVVFFFIRWLVPPFLSLLNQYYCNIIFSALPQLYQQTKRKIF